MFESEAGEAMTTEDVTHLIDTTHRHLVDSETTLLALAAHWADRHSVNPDDPHYSPTRLGPNIEQSRQIGGPGTPFVTEYAAAELGTLQETTTGAATAQMADALDLRHRLPQLWNRVRTGHVRVWKARTVAKATRHLTEHGAAHVDRSVANPITLLPWNRFQNLLDATIIEADPHQAEERAKIWAAEQFVRAGTTKESGLKLLIARADAGDIITFMAMINRIAEILHTEGNTNPVDIRRAQAIAIIAQPALALKKLCDHRHDQDHPAHSPEPDHEDTTPEDPTNEQPAHEQPADDKPVEHEETAHEGEENPDEEKTGHNDDTGDNDETVPDHGESDSTQGPMAPTERHTTVDFAASPDWDLAKARPTVVLYIHLSADALRSTSTSTSTGSGTGAGTGIGNGNVARIEGVGPVTEQQIRDFLNTTHAIIRVQPLLDPDPPPIDAYEIPYRIREAIRARHPAEIFPFGAATSRHMDLDHTTAFTPPAHGGPPGQTSMDNLGPLSRSHHRAKTFGGWNLRQPTPGTYLWRSPHHWVYLVTGTGSQSLGNNTFSVAVWKAAVRCSSSASTTTPDRDPLRSSAA